MRALVPVLAKRRKACPLATDTPLRPRMTIAFKRLAPRTAPSPPWPRCPILLTKAKEMAASFSPGARMGMAMDVGPERARSCCYSLGGGRCHSPPQRPPSQDDDFLWRQGCRARPYQLVGQLLAYP